MGEERVLLTVVRQRGAQKLLSARSAVNPMGRRLGAGGCMSRADRREDGGDGLIVGSELVLEARLELIEAPGERRV